MRVAAYILKIRFLQVAGAPSCLRFRESCFPNGASGTYSSRFNALSHSAPRTSHQTTYSETKGQIRYQDQTEICSRCSSIYCRARRPLATNHPTTLARRSARCQPKDRALTNYSRQDYGVRCRRHRPGAQEAHHFTANITAISAPLASAGTGSRATTETENDNAQASV